MEKRLPENSDNISPEAISMDNPKTDSSTKDITHQTNYADIQQNNPSGEKKIGRRKFLGLLLKGVVVGGALFSFPSIAYCTTCNECTDPNDCSGLIFDNNNCSGGTTNNCQGGQDNACEPFAGNDCYESDNSCSGENSDNTCNSAFPGNTCGNDEGDPAAFNQCRNEANNTCLQGETNQCTDNSSNSCVTEGTNECRGNQSNNCSDNAYNNCIHEEGTNICNSGDSSNRCEGQSYNVCIEGAINQCASGTSGNGNTCEIAEHNYCDPIGNDIPL